MPIKRRMTVGEAGAAPRGQPVRLRFDRGSQKKNGGCSVGRGAPPKSMIKLFHLLRKIPFLPDEEIADELGIKRSTVRNYKWRLSKKIATGVAYFDYCPECFQKSVVLDRETGEYVCTSCGFVVEEDGANISKDIPFGTEENPNTFALTSNIAYGKSLGFTMPKSHLFRVVVENAKKNRSPRVGDDGKIPIPIRQMQAVTQMVDPPIVRSLLNYGSRLMKAVGLDRDTDRDHALADRYGRLLRKIGAYIMVSKSSLQPYRAARAALFYVLSTADPEKAGEFREKFPFDAKYLKLVTTLQTVSF